MVRYLLEQRADVYTCDRRGQSCLHHAVRKGQLELVCMVQLRVYGMVKTTVKSVCYG